MSSSNNNKSFESNIVSISYDVKIFNQEHMKISENTPGIDEIFDNSKINNSKVTEDVLDTNYDELNNKIESFMNSN